MTEPSRVIIVDDDPDLTTLSRMVEQENYAVCSARSQIEMQRAFLDGGADLVISEMASSGVDGFELLKWVKARRPQTHVVLLTGHVTDHGEAILEHRGVDGYLVKPVDRRRLQILLSALLVDENLDRLTDAYVFGERMPVSTQIDAVLGNCGIQTEFFTDPRAVIARSDNDPPHLLVIDLDAGGAEESLELCRRIRRDRTIPYFPILILSETSRRDFVVAAARLHVNGFLAGPIDADELRSRALKLMRHTKFSSSQSEQP